MKVLIAGGLKPGFESGGDEEICAGAIARAFVSAGHIILNGCFNEFDRIVAEAGIEAAKNSDEFPDEKQAVMTYISPDTTPVHQLGVMRKLNVRSWDPGQPKWGIPDPLKDCDVVVVMGGGPSTHRVINLSQFAGKHLLPVTTFGGAADEAYEKVMLDFDSRYLNKIQKDEYSVLNSAIEGVTTADQYDEMAKSIVDLASKIVSGSEVFIAMSFLREAEETFSTIKLVCKDFKFKAIRTDKTSDSDRIFDRIVNGIADCTFVIVDVTQGSVNVYYELGYAEALGKTIIVTAKSETKLPFDTKDLPTIMYSDQVELQQKLSDRIRRMTGRTPSGIFLDD